MIVTYKGYLFLRISACCSKTLFFKDSLRFYLHTLMRRKVFKRKKTEKTGGGKGE
jgi:hypothetical protein